MTGIECAGVVRADPSGALRPGQTVIALVGGMGRSIDGSYAELTLVPATNVAPVDTTLSWAELAALPESYATAWSALVSILNVQHGRKLVVRGATSALGQAALNIAADIGVHAIGTTRHISRSALIETAGACEVMIESPGLASFLRGQYVGGVDAVLDVVGNSTILGSLAMLKRGGEACQLGFLGGGEALNLQPVFQIPSGRRLTVFASALVLGGADFPLSEIPFQAFADKAASGAYRAKPAHIFHFNDIREAHRLMNREKRKARSWLTSVRAALTSGDLRLQFYVAIAGRQPTSSPGDHAHPKMRLLSSRPFELQQRGRISAPPALSTTIGVQQSICCACEKPFAAQQ